MLEKFIADLYVLLLVGPDQRASGLLPWLILIGLVGGGIFFSWALHFQRLRGENDAFRSILANGRFFWSGGCGTNMILLIGLLLGVVFLLEQFLR